MYAAYMANTVNSPQHIKSFKSALCDWDPPDIEVMEALLASGKIDLKDSNPKAQWLGHRMMTYWVDDVKSDSGLDTMRLGLKYGVSPDVVCKGRELPIIEHAMFGVNHSLLTLVEAGANLNAPCAPGRHWYEVLGGLDSDAGESRIAQFYDDIRSLFSPEMLKQYPLGVSALYHSLPESWTMGKGECSDRIFFYDPLPTVKRDKLIDADIRSAMMSYEDTMKALATSSIERVRETFAQPAPHCLAAGVAACGSERKI